MNTTAAAALESANASATVTSDSVGRRLVLQRYGDDCAVACVATLAAVDYRAADAALGRPTGPVIVPKIVDALHRLTGRRHYQTKRQAGTKLAAWRSPAGAAMVLVKPPSGHADAMAYRRGHFVVLDGWHVLDPEDEPACAISPADACRVSDWLVCYAIQPDFR